MIRIVTIEREYGSGAANIARKLAERMGWTLWDQALTDEIARLMDCPSQTVVEREERRDTLTYRLFKSFMRGSFEGSVNAPRLKMVDADCIREVAQRLVIDIAQKGNAVIVGRGAAYYLHDRADALHIFIYAPFEEKVHRLISTGKTENEAVELVETVDQERSEYIQKYFNIEWPSREFFHLMINSGIGEEMAIETILNAVSKFDKQPV
ncbi:MAG TPA: cytidylate kinase-like family protein [Bryobacteraceae bacterium]